MRRRVFFSAGELSGEHHAARVVRELKALVPDIAVDAFGGRDLEAAGARLLFPLSDYAVMGFKAVFENLGRFVGVLRQFARYLADERPDAVVLVDYPGLHLRMAALARRAGVPVLYYVCPQLWAWAPWRARRFAAVVDEALAILPFEEPYFRSLGIGARFVGHPVADALREPDAAPESLALEAEVRAAAPGIALLPGSRPSEARANLPWLIDVARLLRRDFPAATFFLPQLRADTRALCAGLLAGADAPSVRLVSAVRPVLRAARAALVTSGTATFEIACHEVPMVVVYSITPLQRFLGGQLLTVPWISLANLVAGCALVPEFVTPDRPVEAIAASARALIADGAPRDRCLAGLRAAFRDTFQPGASRRAAQAVVDLLDRQARIPRESRE